MNKKLTIIIPNKDGQTPSVTVDSLYKQTFKDFDIIIINDLVGNANVARNEGLKYVKTPYVLFSDNDINWFPNALMEMYKCLEDNPNVSYAYGAYSFTNSNQLICDVQWNPQLLKRHNYISTMSIVRTKDHCGFDEDIRRLQDWDVWLTLLQNYKIGKYTNTQIFTTDIRAGISATSISEMEAMDIIRKKHNL